MGGKRMAMNARKTSVPHIVVVALKLFLSGLLLTEKQRGTDEKRVRYVVACWSEWKRPEARR